MSFLSRLLIFFLFTFIPKAWANRNVTQTFIKIELPDQKPTNELNFFHIYELESFAQHKIVIQNVDNKETNIFGLLQIHSFKFSVSLDNLRGNITYGTNIGFLVTNNAREFLLMNKNNFLRVEVAIAFVSMDPKMSDVNNNCTNLNPMLEISGERNEETDIITFSNTLISDVNCVPRADVTYESRYKYLRTGDMTSYTYFEGIKDMITINEARKNGKENDLVTNEGNERKNLFAKIKGTGIVFQTIVFDNNGHFAYIPAVSYSCNVHAWKNDCTLSDPLNLGFYSILIIISILMMTRMLLPRTLNHLSVGMGSGLVLGVFLTIFINMEMNWKAFVTIFTSITCTAMNYFANQRYDKISHYLSSFWLCFVSSLTLFYVANFSFNLVDYQYIFLVGFTIIGTILIAILDRTEYHVSIVLGGFLFMFSITFFTSGHLNNIIEQPFYLAKDWTYVQAVKRLLVAPQDAIAFCFAVILVACLIISYNCHGNVWEKSRAREKLLRARRVALGGGTLHERLQVASEQTPLISRYTETEEDEVFESPNTNRELYSKRNGRKN